MYKDKRVEKKKTVVMKRCLNPVFNESFAFDIPTERLRETTIVITVMDKDRLSRNDVIGKVGTGACPADEWQLGDSRVLGWWHPVPSRAGEGGACGGPLVLGSPAVLVAVCGSEDRRGDNAVSPARCAMPWASRHVVLG